MTDRQALPTTLWATAGLSALAAAGLTAAWFRHRAASASHGSTLQPVCSCRAVASETSPQRHHRKPDPYDPLPRSEYLSWDDYFIALAFLSAQRSKDPNKQVGAVLVSQGNIILGIGYNGFPRGCSDSQLPWAKCSHDGDILATKYPYVCHAEMNAVLNKNTASLAGAKIYVTMFPCNECAKLLIQAGIKEVIYFESKNTTARDLAVRSGMQPDQVYAASKRMLAMTGVQLRQYQPQRQISLHMGASRVDVAAAAGADAAKAVGKSA